MENLEINSAGPQDQETTQAPSGRPKVTQELITARFKIELAKDNYQKIIQKLEDYVVTEDNRKEAQDSLKAARVFVAKLKAIKDNGKAPAWEECKMWDGAYNSLLDPLQELLDKKASALSKIEAEVVRKQQEAEKEATRIKTIRADIESFVLAISQSIAEATTPETIVNIEKLIGSHKANKTRYREFLPELVQKCDALLPLIKSQKDTIRELVDVKAKKQKADEADDDESFINLHEKEEELEAKIAEQQVTVQEKAIDAATKTDNVEIAQPVYNTLNARRRTWKWEVTDMKELQKKNPELVMLVPNEEKIKELLRAKIEAGETKKTEEIVLPGIRFYVQKSY